MKKSYYLFNPGQMSRKDNTLQFTQVDEEGCDGAVKYIPIEPVDNLYAFGSLDANSALYNFLGKENISVHFFDYYEHYTGSFMPKDYLLSGKMIIAQAEAYQNKNKRITIARKIIDGAVANMLKNLKYYNNREKNTSQQIAAIEELQFSVIKAPDVESLMGIEGNIRTHYYAAFSTIVNDYEMGLRTRLPPNNELNTMISFVNSLCYTVCLDDLSYSIKSNY